MRINFGAVLFYILAKYLMIQLELISLNLGKLRTLFVVKSLAWMVNLKHDKLTKFSDCIKTVNVH